MGWYRGPALVPFTTHDKRGTSHQFYYHVEDHGFERAYDFSVHVVATPQWPPTDWPVYELSIQRNHDDELQTINMDNHNLPAYRGKGITEALLIEIAVLLGEDIVSSPSFEHMGNRRSPQATIVWERLVSAGVAVRAEDRFRLLCDRTKPGSPP